LIHKPAVAADAVGGDPDLFKAVAAVVFFGEDFKECGARGAKAALVVSEKSAAF
jgi:hypothetical protein